MRFVTAFAFTFVCLSLGGPALGADPTTAAFGVREYIQQISLSPDGQQVAMIVPGSARGSKLVTINIATGASKTILVSSGDPERLTYCRWSTNTRLVCQIYAMIKNGESKVG